MNRWFWVRHGPTHEKTMVGHRDVPADLSDTALIDRVKAALPSKALLFSSDLIRAADTARVICPRGTEPTQTAAFREIDFGAWDGLHWTVIGDRWPDLSRAFWEQPGDHRAPNGESWNDALHRISSEVDRLNAMHQNTDFIVAAHFGAILTQYQRASGKTAYQTLGQKIDNFSITQLNFYAGDWDVALINHIP